MMVFELLTTKPKKRNDQQTVLPWNAKSLNSTESNSIEATERNQTKKLKLSENAEEKKKRHYRVTYTIGLLEDGTWVITELDVGDGRACCITALASEVARRTSEVARRTFGTWSDAGRTIVDVGSEVGCRETSCEHHTRPCIKRFRNSTTLWTKTCLVLPCF